MVDNILTCDNFSFSGDVTCFGDDCYSLAFGVPAALMIIAISKICYCYHDH